MANTGTARRFTDEDKARILATLAANAGNVKRTARECSVLPATIRRWREQDKIGAGPPADTKAAAVDAFVADAERVRNMALAELEEKISSGEVSARDLVTTLGVLDDKLTRAKGMPTSNVHHTAALPSREELSELLTGYVREGIAAAEQRQLDIVDVEVIREIPATTTAE